MDKGDYRSKGYCESCIRRKAECDLKRPRCRTCARLHLKCKYSPSVPISFIFQHEHELDLTSRKRSRYDVGLDNSGRDGPVQQPTGSTDGVKEGGVEENISAEMELESFMHFLDTSPNFSLSLIGPSSPNGLGASLDPTFTIETPTLSDNAGSPVPHHILLHHYLTKLTGYTLQSLLIGHSARIFTINTLRPTLFSCLLFMLGLLLFATVLTN